MQEATKVKCSILMLGLALVAQSVAAANLTGVVCGADGAPVANILVEAYGERGANGKRQILGSGATDGRGRFTIPAERTQTALVTLLGKVGVGRVVLPPGGEALTLRYPVKSTVALLHDNDMHFDFNYGEQLKAFVAEARRRYNSVLLLCAGDLLNRHKGTWGGDDQADSANYAARARYMVDQLNACGYEALTPGNHELDYIEGYTRAALDRAKFPILSANVEITTELLPQMHPYHIFTLANDQTVAVMGLSTGLTKAGVKLLSPYETAAKYTNLVDQHTLFVGLTHIGFIADLKLAERFPEFDVIIGGHSHTLLNESLMVNGVLVAQAGGAGHQISPTNPKFIGVVEIELENDRVVKKVGSVMNLAQKVPLNARWGFLPPQDSGVAQAAFYVVNPSFSAQTVKVELGVAQSKKSWQQHTVTVPPRETITIPYQVKSVEGGARSFDLTANIYVDGATKVERTVKQQVQLLPKVRNVVVDGSLAEWQRQGWQQEFTAKEAKKGPLQEGTPDMVGRVVLGWSAEGLWFGLETTDQDHHCQRTKKGVWRGDGVTFALAPAVRGDITALYGSDTVGQIYMTDSGAKLVPEKGAMADQVARYAAKRSAERAQTSYECLLPLAPAGIQGRSGEAFIFNMALLDDDSGAGVSSYYQIKGGIYPRQNPRSFPLFLLVE